jgi:hypothetical protein
MHRSCQHVGLDYVCLWLCQCGLLCVVFPGCAALSRQSADNVASFVRSEDQQFRRYVDNWQETKSKNLVMQEHEYTCGAAALATLMIYYFGEDITEKKILDVIEKQMPADEWAEKFTSGLSVRDLMNGARKLGYEAESRELKLSDLIALTAPVIVHLEDNDFQHFVVYRGVVEDRVYLADPILGNIRVPIDKFKDQWTGIALALSKEGIEPGDDHAFAVDKSRTSRPELQAARRSIADSTRVSTRPSSLLR